MDSGYLPRWSANPAEVINKDFAKSFPLQILVTDDNYINRRVLSLLLQRLGYPCHTAESGGECLEAVLLQHYDLLLMDINMPDMSGIECTELIRQAGLEFPIVAVTAAPPEICREPSFAAGMSGFISKPIQLGQLIEVLRAASYARERKLCAT